MKKTKERDLVDRIKKRIELAHEHDSDNREQAAIDLRFLAGDQWDEASRQQRDSEGRPTLTINRLPQFVRQVTNDVRQADLAIKAIPVDDRGDPALAKIYDGLLRQIHYRSSASHVYAIAAEHQCACGIGWLRVLTDYVDDESFEQEIRLETILSPLSVYCDPAAVLPDRSDAEWIAVTELIPTATFEERYPDAASEGIDVPDNNQSGSSVFLWNEGDKIRIAEYWEKTYTKRTLAQLETGEVLEKSQVPAGARILRERIVDVPSVKSYIVSGTEVLEESEWAGKHIPIVAVIGAEVPLEGQSSRSGVVRFARDPAQLYNKYRTAWAEHVGMSPKSPYLATAEMIKPYRGMWDSANIYNRPYLLYRPDPDAPGARPERILSPDVPVALIQGAEIAAEELKAVTGIYDAALGARSNETSGRAIDARDRQGDTANYHYIDNLRRSLEHVGRILLDLIPRVYDTERVIRLMGEDEREDMVQINQFVGFDERGQPVYVNDLSVARFDVRVSIGQAYTTRRQESRESMMSLIQAVPGFAQAAGDLIVKSFDFPGADELAKRLRALVPPDVLAAAENDSQGGPPPPQQSPPPDPLQQAGVEAEVRKMQAQAEREAAAARKIHAEADQIEAAAMLYGGGVNAQRSPFGPTGQYQREER